MDDFVDCAKMVDMDAVWMADNQGYSSTDEDNEDASDASEGAGTESEQTDMEDNPVSAESLKRSNNDEVEADSAESKRARVLALAATGTMSSENKKHKRGVVYLSTIPHGMTVKGLRLRLEEFGQIDRIFLQPRQSVRDRRQRERQKDKKRQKSRGFTEGWVEFIRKSVAKNVAAMLNNKTMKGRKKSPFFDQVWSMKYLPGFKWRHLTEQMEYERQKKRERMREEIRSVKKEVDKYQRAVGMAKRKKNLRKTAELDL